ncbi:hypothetical protein GCM10023175_40840 [Pseudonocardia xishanensis]|uniref:Uncharacterized protein n=1 Tax=Pseudonocardia xishanensis TaxID=630995 RepID=A0ABP8RWF6_9PSEU
MSIRVLPASSAVGRWGKDDTGTDITTISPAAAASSLVVADACGPGRAIVSGPRELLSTT